MSKHLSGDIFSDVPGIMGCFGGPALPQGDPTGADQEFTPQCVSEQLATLCPWPSFFFFLFTDATDGSLLPLYFNAQTSEGHENGP